LPGTVVLEIFRTVLAENPSGGNQACLLLLLLFNQFENAAANHIQFNSFYNFNSRLQDENKNIKKKTRDVCPARLHVCWWLPANAFQINTKRSAE